VICCGGHRLAWSVDQPFGVLKGGGVLAFAVQGGSVLASGVGQCVFCKGWTRARTRGWSRARAGTAEDGGTLWQARRHSHACYAGGRARRRHALTEEGGSSLAPEGGSSLAPEGGSSLAPEGGSSLAPEGGSSLAPEGGTPLARFIQREEWKSARAGSDRQHA
jgi:hypothetical protein